MSQEIPASTNSPKRAEKSRLERESLPLVTVKSWRGSLTTPSRPSANQRPLIGSSSWAPTASGIRKKDMVVMLSPTPTNFAPARAYTPTPTPPSLQYGVQSPASEKNTPSPALALFPAPVAGRVGRGALVVGPADRRWPSLHLCLAAAPWDRPATAARR